MLTVWGRRSSFNLQKVMWLLGELSLEHRHIEVGGQFGGLDAPEFMAMNPHGRIPVIDDGGTIVWESHSILRYLAARYGRSRFWADDAGARSQADRWMDWSQSALQPDFLMGVFWGFYRTPEPQRDWMPSATSSPAAHGISNCWTSGSRTGPSCAATPSPWPTFPPAPRFTAISSWRSSGHPFQTSKHGIDACRNATPIASTSWCHLANYMAAWTIRLTSMTSSTIRPLRGA
jgi:hypothetical protein